MEHKTKANALLANATETREANTMGLGILDAILILFTLDVGSKSQASAFNANFEEILMPFSVLLPP
jgi:hypothetical protein